MAKLKSKGNLAERVFWIAVIICLMAVGFMLYKQHCVKDEIVIYDLSWQAKDRDGKVVFNRWRYFIKYPACLPVRIEKYSTADPNGGYALKEVLVIDQ